MVDLFDLTLVLIFVVDRSCFSLDRLPQVPFEIIDGKSVLDIANGFPPLRESLRFVMLRTAAQC
jgi:hypothetical protein